MLAATRRRASAFPLPAHNIVNVVPLIPGPQSIVHPSVVDMGARWNGYRWWRADTPMPDEYENPSIWASNDRVNWTVPPGLTNPIDPWPGAHINNLDWFNSDTELVWDPVGQRLVVFWREVAPPGAKYFAASSRDGSTWLHHGLVIPPIASGANLSAGIARDPATGQWRALMFGGSGAVWTAPDVLGPWEFAATPTGWLSGDPGLAYHGDMIWHDGYWLAIAQTRWLGVLPAISEDGYAWTWGTDPIAGGYRVTMLPSTQPGYFDVWGSEPNRYYRFAQSIWFDLLT
jgi:hypothetical protein